MLFPLDDECPYSFPWSVFSFSLSSLISIFVSFRYNSFFSILLKSERPPAVAYTSLESVVLDLEKQGMLIRIKEEMDPHLEMAELHLKTFKEKGPALLFENVKGSPFRAVSNLFGTEERCRFIFRERFELVKEAIKLKASPEKFMKTMLQNKFRPMSLYSKMPFVGLSSLPKKVSPKKSPVLSLKTTLSELPQIVCWPKDGGAFITQGGVFSRPLSSDSIMASNLGMYRAQISGNEYIPDKELGLHYQIHRGLGIHHSEALEAGEDLPVTIFVGGNPAHTLSAVMPMPEGMSELIFAGMLSGRRFRYAEIGAHTISSEADFCITGWLRGKKTKPEGPFGDHLGYYSLKHEFPYLEVDKVYHRPNAIWPFTVVGRPPQEDSFFGSMIHDLTCFAVPSELPGIKELHAVDEAGVHPLLLAIGSERYVPYKKRRPQELLTQSNAILGFGQCSLAKYLFIVAREDNEALKASKVQDFFSHLLERVDFTRDLHFQTSSTIDTLDYSGEGLNKGSKLVLSSCGDKIRRLSVETPTIKLAQRWKNLCVVSRGILSVELPDFSNYENEPDLIEGDLQILDKALSETFPLIVLVDDSYFVSCDFSNFLWVVFTRSNPSRDVYGVQSFTHFKHWGCRGSLVVDARSKPHHAPALP